MNIIPNWQGFGMSDLKANLDNLNSLIKLIYFTIFIYNNLVDSIQYIKETWANKDNRDMLLDESLITKALAQTYPCLEEGASVNL